MYDLVTDTPVNTPKSYGKSIKPADLPDGIARFFPIAPADPPAPTTEPSSTGTGTGLPADVLLQVLETLREDVAEIRAVLAEVHMRMVGGSLLIIYEADVERARKGLEWMAEHREDEDDEDEDDEDEESGKVHVGAPYLVKLIDFAHTKIVPGIGPDEGVLKGVDTVLSLLDGRIGQVQVVVGSA